MITRHCRLKGKNLALLVESFRNQMNQHLIEAVLGEISDRNGLGTASFEREVFPSKDSLLAYIHQVSNNRAEVGKIDVTIASGKKSDDARPDTQFTKRSTSGRDLESLINRAAGIHQLDPGLIRAVVRTESDFNSNAVSTKGAKGLMQLMPATAKELGVHDPFDPEENIMAGARYLKELLNRYEGNVDLALAAYNWGMGNVEKNPGRLPKETLNYIAKVNQHYRG